MEIAMDTKGKGQDMANGKLWQGNAAKRQSKRLIFGVAGGGMFPPKPE
jgi:hypothetical protein